MLYPKAIRIIELRQTKLIQPTFIVLVLIISWSSGLDTLAAYVNSESIKDGAIIYGLARSINGVISVIQSAEIGGVIGSVHPGELLDPINDLIERFSSVMAWSLSSLVLQKVLLTIFNSIIFKLIFTVVCISVLFARFIFKTNSNIQKMWSLFLIVASLRFSISIVCALTAIVDYGFIQEIEQTSLKTVRQFNSDISVGINAVTETDENISTTVDTYKSHKEETISEHDQIKSELIELEKQLEGLPSRSLIDVMKRKKKSKEVLLIERQIETKKTSLERIEKKLLQLDSSIECEKLKNEGQSCEGNWSKIKNLFSGDKIAEISSRLNQTVNELMTVLVSLVLTTIILPLIFLYVAMKTFKVMVTKVVMLTNDFNSDLNQIKKTLTQQQNKSVNQSGQ